MASKRSRNQQHQDPGNRGRVLRIGVILGGTIVEERLVRETGDVTIGQSAKNLFSVPVDGLPRSWSLFTQQDGRYTLQFSDGMDGRISDGPRVRTLDALKGKGAQQRGNAWVYPLPETARGKISLGEMTLLLQFVSEPPRQPRPHLPASVRGTLADRLDPQLSVIMAISVLIHFSIGLWAYQHDRVVDKRAQRVYNDTFQRPVIAAVDTTFEQPTQPTETTDEPAAKVDKKPDEPSKGTAKKANPGPKKGSGGSSGRNSAEAIRLAEEEAVRLANALVSDDVDPFGGPGGSSGRDPKADLEKQVDQVNRSNAKVEIGGGSGRGTRGDPDTRIGTGKGPDVSAPGETTTAGPKRTEKVPKSRIKIGGRSALDDTTLTPDKVMRKINSRYMAGLKRCHNELLKRDPSAGGSVTLRFTVGASGRVTRASAKGFDPGVDACITSRVKGWRFNAPKDEDGEETDAAFKITLALQGS